jgi:hypothetical protein
MRGGRARNEKVSSRREGDRPRRQALVSARFLERQNSSTRRSTHLLLHDAKGALAHVICGDQTYTSAVIATVFEALQTS